MKIARHVALLLGLSVVLVCSWLAPMDSPAMTQVDAGLKRALISFATARTLNGLISIIQAAQIDIQPAGLGVTLSPGQLLAPVNELVRHFADLMLIACVAFGVQKVLISISGYWLISLVLTATAAAWAGFHLRQRHAPVWLSKTLVLMLMLRFAIPVAMLGTDALSQRFLAANYTTAQAAIDTAALQANKVKAPEPPAADASAWASLKPTWLAGIPDVKARFVEMRQAVEQSTEQMITLMVVFLLQTLLMPLLLIWGLYAVAKIVIARPMPSPKEISSY